MSEVAMDEQRLEALRDSLKAQKKFLAVAESCTGGLLSEKLVAVPGISAVYRGGIISYQNEVKEKLLDVSAELLQKEGAVSSSCAIQMALAVCTKMNADYSLAITGFAGPKSHLNDEVGLVFIACVHPKGVECREYHFSGSREMIREQAAKAAMALLHCFVQKNEDIER